MTPVSIQAWIQKRVTLLLLAAIQCTPLLVLGWGIGRLLKDRVTTRTLLLLYALPAPVVAAACALWFMRTLNRKPGLLNGWMKAGLAAALVQCLVLDCAWNVPRDATGDESIRIVNWNLGRVQQGGERLWSAIRAEQPDICLITERPKKDHIFDPRLVGLPDADVQSMGELVLVSTFPLSSYTAIETNAGTAFSCNVNTPSGTLLFVAVDFHSHPLQDIRDALAAILQSVQPALDAGTPVVIAGDFNKARDSTQLNPLRRFFHHAYEERGNGWPYTWPSLLPLWSIDHVWCSDKLGILSYDLFSVLPSDHVRQTIDLALSP